MRPRRSIADPGGRRAGAAGTALAAAGFTAVERQLHRGRRLADALDELAARRRPGGTRAGVVDRDRPTATGCRSRRCSTAWPPRRAPTRRRLGQAEARRLPVRLSFPLVVCTLPSFVLLAIAPAVLGAISTLRGTRPVRRPSATFRRLETRCLLWLPCSPACTPPCWSSPIRPLRRLAPRRGRGDRGQATTEYALVLLAAALVALLVVAWATAGGGAGQDRPALQPGHRLGHRQGLNGASTHAGDAGQAAVELALVLPVVVVLLLGMLQVALVGRDQLALELAAREGARAAAVSADPAAAARAAADRVTSLHPLSVDVSVAATTVTVTVRHRSVTDIADRSGG